MQVQVQGGDAETRGRAMTGTLVSGGGAYFLE